MKLSWLSFWAFLLISLSTNFAFGEESVRSFLKESNQELAQAQLEYEIAIGHRKLEMPASAASADPQRQPAGKDFAIAIRTADSSPVDKH